MREKILNVLNNHLLLRGGDKIWGHIYCCKDDINELFTASMAEDKDPA